MPVRVLIVDDQKMQRKALESFLESAEGFEIADSLSSAELAVSYCRKNPVDMAVLDVVMDSGISGIEAAAQIKALDPRIKVVLVSSMPEVSFLERARKAGADSFWYKEFDSASLLQVMQRTMAGERIFPDATPPVQLGNASSAELTGRELDVLRLVTLGKTDQEIAEELDISVWTCRSHVQHMMQKTGYKNRVELAVRARSAGLVIDE